MSPKTGKSGFYGHFQSSEMAFCMTFGQNNDYFFHFGLHLGQLIPEYKNTLQYNKNKNKPKVVTPSSL